MNTPKTMHVAIAPMPLIRRDFRQCDLFSIRAISAIDLGTSGKFLRCFASRRPVNLCRGALEDFIFAESDSSFDEAFARARIARRDFPSRHQCTTMPDCESVKDRKTPTAYSGISRLVSPRNAQTNKHEKIASSTIPFEKTSRSPRFA